MPGKVIEAGRDVIVESPLVTGWDVLHEAGHPGEGDLGGSHILVDVAAIVNGSNCAVGLRHAEPWHGDERRCAHSFILAGSNLGKESVLRSLV